MSRTLMNALDMQYAPDVFNQPNLKAAKEIILTQERHEGAPSPEERWVKETAWIVPYLKFKPGELVIDYGCGIGRIAKELKQNPVLGVDISPVMRANSESYVRRPDFGVTCPSMLHVLARSGLKAYGAYAIWVLQHCYDPEADIRIMAETLLIGAPLYVLNLDHRAVPSRASGSREFVWYDDGLDINKLLENWFIRESEIDIPDELSLPKSTFTIWSRNNCMMDNLDAPRTQERGAMQ